MVQHASRHVVRICLPLPSSDRPHLAALRVVRTPVELLADVLTLFHRAQHHRHTTDWA